MSGWKDRGSDLRLEVEVSKEDGVTKIGTSGSLRCGIGRSEAWKDRKRELRSRECKKRFRDSATSSSNAHDV